MKAPNRQICQPRRWWRNEVGGRAYPLKLEFSKANRGEGNGLGFSMGRAAGYGGMPHNRLLLALARAIDHTDFAQFGNPDFCGDGPLTGLA